MEHILPYSPVSSSAAAKDDDDKLLPDLLPDPYQRPYTLVLELNDALVHLVWDKETGWRGIFSFHGYNNIIINLSLYLVATRPGVKQFLSYLSRYYELVIFTSSQNYVSFLIYLFTYS